MNRRRAILAALLAPFGVKGQDMGSAIAESVAGKTWLISTPADSGNSFLGKRKPLNNQCPVCGAMAEPCSRKKWVEEANKGPCAGSWSTNNLVCSPATIEMSPKQNLTRCKNCNAAFWQDAE